MIINPFILEFLEALNANNNREWFAEHKADYQKAKALFEDAVTQLIQTIKEIDPEVGHLEAKDCVFRIFRDTRFSHNKIPYKNNMGAYIAKGGRKSPLAGYYFHVEPGNSMFASGVYTPEKEVLYAVRKEVMNFGDEFEALLNDSNFKRLYPELMNDRLKMAPKGFAKDHEHIEWLKYKSFIVSHSLTNDALMAPSFPSHLQKLIKAAQPLTQFLNNGILHQEDELSLD